MTLKDYITLSISIAAFTISILSLATDTRGLSVNVRGGSLDQETRVYEVQLFMINSGTKEIMIYAPDVTDSKRKQDRECPKNLISNLNAPRLDESYTIKAGAVVHHTLKFKLQSLQPDFWTLCIDFKIADFFDISQEVRFKSGSTRALN
jgi:hypothetical protein